MCMFMISLLMQAPLRRDCPKDGPVDTSGNTESSMTNDKHNNYVCVYNDRHEQ